MKNPALRCVSVFLAAALLLGGCAADPESGASSSGGETSSDGTAGSDVSSEVTALDPEELFTDRDYRTDYEDAVDAVITLEGSTASCDSDAVEIDGSTVTIADEGTYLLTGTLTDGSILVDAGSSDKVWLVLENVSVTSETFAALYVREADKVFVTLADGSENTLANGGSFVPLDENSVDAVIFSKEDLTLNGSGSLTVESPAGHGIVSKDDLVITGGTYTVTSAKQGLGGKDSVRIAGGTFQITAGTDGIHSENADDTEKGFVCLEAGTFAITAEGDGISASGLLQIDGGEYTITAGGGSVNGSKEQSDSWGHYRGRNGMGQTTMEDSGSSMKGIKAGTNMVISGGSFLIDSADDGIHANGSVSVSGGTFSIASGDDGMHADETLTISDGTVTVSESYEGLEGLHLVLSGGTLTITATDDGLNAAGGSDESGFGGRDARFGGWSTSSDGTLLISGGTVKITASGDAIDANGTLEITGGTVLTSGPNSGDTSILDYDTSGTISGGTFIGLGASSMTEHFSAAENQGAIMATFSAQSAGTTVTLTASDGTVLLEETAEQDFSCVILSCPALQKGETCTLTVGSDTQTITLDSLLTTVGNRGPGGW